MATSAAIRITSYEYGCAPSREHANRRRLVVHEGGKGARDRQAYHGTGSAVRAVNHGPRSSSSAQLNEAWLRAFTVRFALAGLVAIVALVIVAGVSDMLVSTRTGKALEGATTELVVVTQGDTLWSVAEAHPLEGCTTSELVRTLKEMNSVEDGLIKVGDRLLIPVR